MLDTHTKRRIDTARDILVGKVPDPKSQVEQITIALIYKFMDDMDAESEELGGKRKFFTSDFARYGWAKLMRSGLGGHETLALYGEGITKMTENPGLPPLFRAIEKNDLPQVQAELELYLNGLRSGAFRAKGPTPSQPGATPQENVRNGKGLQARPISRADGSGFQPSDSLPDTIPGAMPQAGMGCAFGAPFTCGLIVPKEKIAANGDYNLSGERYREGIAKTNNFPLVAIGEVCTVNPKKNQLDGKPLHSHVSFVPMADLGEHQIAFQPSEERALSEVGTSYTCFEDNDVLLAKVTPCFENGKAGIARSLGNGIGFGSSEFYVLRSNGQVLPEWVYFCVMHPIFREAAVAQMTGTGGLQRVPRSYVENFQIPIPPLPVQKEIVAEIEAEQALVAANRELITRFERKIQATLARIWGEDSDSANNILLPKDEPELARVAETP